MVLLQSASIHRELDIGRAALRGGLDRCLLGDWSRTCEIHAGEGWEDLVALFGPNGLVVRVWEHRCAG
jgi:hypothetical protein